MMGRVRTGLFRRGTPDPTMSADPKTANAPQPRMLARVTEPLRALRSRTHWLLWKEVGWPVAGLALALVGIVVAAVLARPRGAGATAWVLIDVALVTAAVVLVALLLLRIFAQLIEPLAHLRHWAQSLRSGHFSARMPDSAGGEFGELARDINRLASWLESMTLAMDHQVRAQKLRLARKTQSLDILYDVAAGLNRPGGLDKQLEGFLDTFIAFVDGLAASVHLRAEDGSTRLVASRGPEAELANRKLIATHCPHCGWEATRGHIHFQHGPELTCAKITPPQILDSRFRMLVVVPVRYQDNPLGVYCLMLDRPVNALGEDALDLLIAIARHLGLAVEKARLDQDARRLAVMEERQLIGNELHDSLAQALVGMRLQIKMLGESLHRKDLRAAQNEVRSLKSAADEAHSSLRELLANFRLKIDDRGLVPAVKDLVERFRQDTSVAVFFHNECQELDITPAQEIQVFHIIQEALANIRKHSHAHNARILLNRNTDGQYTVLIEDDGYGISPAPEGRPGEHLGLTIMRERAERLPGELAVESEPGEGTRVVLTFPVAREARTRAARG
jgi:two-component system nitrate/nitrite sensor histidine kinase NarX